LIHPVIDYYGTNIVNTGKGGDVKTALNVSLTVITPLLFLLLGGCGNSAHNLHVTSDPSGAAVSLDNMVVCETPCDVTLSQRVGDYNIYTFRAVKDDYMPGRKAYKEELYHQTVSNVVPETVHFELRKREIYEVSMTSDPSGAVIQLNGEVIGETPFTAKIKEPIEDNPIFTFVATKTGFRQVKKELRDFEPRKKGAALEFPETIHFDMEN